MNKKKDIKDISFSKKPRQVLAPGNWLAVLFKRLLLVTIYDFRISMTFGITFLCSWLLVLDAYTQQLAPFSNEYNRRIEYDMVRSNTPFFTVLKPYYETKYYSLDTLAIFKSKTKTGDSWLKRKLFNESFIQVDSPDFHLYADPVFEFGVGKEMGGRNTYINTRGFRAGGRLTSHIAFGVDFYENQGIFNAPVTSRIKQLGVAPGEGLARKYDSTGYDFAHSTGYLSILLLNNLNIQLAYDRQFIGDGYRSLLLSDASYPYPHFKLAWSNKSFFYTWDNILLQDLDMGMAAKKTPMRRKFATIHTGAFIFLKKAQISITKIQLYNNPDSFGVYTPDFNQLNPLIIPFNTQLRNHSIWGVNFKVEPLNKLFFYNQFVIDNLFSGLKQHIAVQFGAKLYSSRRNHKLYLQAEYNRVPNMTYTSSYKIFNWRNFREALAHPYGHNFEESILICIWTYRSIQINGQMNFARQLQYIQKPETYTRIDLDYFKEGKRFSWSNLEFKYFLNRKTLMNLALGYIYRTENLNGDNTNKFMYLSFGTNLFNKYYDF